ncbi:MAG: response regulator [Elusimicrobia bacterium]|nr:response regulator [Elusimicrobiota bacterium]
MTQRDDASQTILLVEDSPGDVRLAQEALRENGRRTQVVVAGTGEEALALLRDGGAAARLRPDLILLDLNLPGMDGRELLAELKMDPDLKAIPVVILSTSQHDADVSRVYDLHGNCYINKPMDYERFVELIRKIEDFWLTVARLPGGARV